VEEFLILKHRIYSKLSNWNRLKNLRYAGIRVVKKIAN